MKGIEKWSKVHTKKNGKNGEKCEKKKYNGEKRNIHIHTLKSLPTRRQTSVANETAIAGVKETENATWAHVVDICGKVSVELHGGTKKKMGRPGYPMRCEVMWCTWEHRACRQLATITAFSMHRGDVDEKDAQEKWVVGGGMVFPLYFFFLGGKVGKFCSSTTSCQQPLDTSVVTWMEP